MPPQRRAKLRRAPRPPPSRNPPPPAGGKAAAPPAPLVCDQLAPREHADGLAHALSVANRMPGRYRSEPRRVRALRHCPEREQRGIEGEQSSWALAKRSRVETHT